MGATSEHAGCRRILGVSESTASTRILLAFVPAVLGLFIGAGTTAWLLVQEEPAPAEPVAAPGQPAAGAPAASASPASPASPTEPGPVPRRRTVASQSDPAEIERLMALGYVSGTVDPEADKTGVLVHDGARAWAGLNFYYSDTRHRAQLVDMAGEEVHAWELDRGPWTHAELLPNGDLVVVVKDKEIFRIDRDSKLLWSYPVRAHHDLFVHDTGEIYALVREGKRMPKVHPVLPVLEEFIQVLSADGKPVRRISLTAALERSPHRYLRRSVAHLVPEKTEGELDIMHSNHVEVFRGAQAALGPMYARGNILVSMRNNHAIAILDGGTGDILWLWGPSNLSFQHHPVLLQGGNLLVLSNGTEKSKVFEVDPRSNTIVWQYAAPDFFTAMRGSNQRLPNDNTLITESDIGHVMEVTRAGEVVWKFANPDVHGELRHAIWRMTRYSRDALPFLAPAE